MQQCPVSSQPLAFCSHNFPQTLLSLPLKPSRFLSFSAITISTQTQRNIFAKEIECEDCCHSLVIQSEGTAAGEEQTVGIIMGLPGFFRAQFAEPFGDTVQRSDIRVGYLADRSTVEMVGKRVSNVQTCSKRSHTTAVAQGAASRLGVGPLGFHVGVDHLDML